jgi:hypothetical protein
VRPNPCCGRSLSDRAYDGIWEAAVERAPFWTERLDEQAESFGGFCEELRLKPSEYFARQCWISFEIDEKTLPVLTPMIGADKVVWGSDYPHHYATFRGALEALYRTIAPMAPEARAKVLGHNAASLYGVGPPRHRPALGRGRRPAGAGRHRPAHGRQASPRIGHLRDRRRAHKAP